MNTTYKSNNNVVYSCKYHVVWCPKYRRKVLTNGVDTRLKELLTEYAANLSVDILEMEIMPDHVHMLLEVDPQFGIHKAVKSFKGYTSRILRQEFPYLKTKMPTLWTNSYFVSTVGGAPQETVKQYIENHDKTRIIDRFLMPEDQNRYSEKMLPVTNFFLPGIVFLYQGQEIGMRDNPKQSIQGFVDKPTFAIYDRLIAEGKTDAEALEQINRESREHFSASVIPTSSSSLRAF